MFVRVCDSPMGRRSGWSRWIASIDDTGRPPRVPIKRLQLVFDEAQGTAVVVHHFDCEENLRAGADTFAAMDPSDTPGSRVPVDTGGLKVESDL